MIGLEIIQIIQTCLFHKDKKTMKGEKRAISKMMIQSMNKANKTLTKIKDKTQQT